MKIRPETAADIEAIHRINVDAFETEAEANLVDALRDCGVPLISLVAVTDEKVIGHILFSPMTDSRGNDIAVAGLAPMAVSPSFQNQGAGSALVKEGLRQCKAAGYQAVVVLGHPDYYPRFGFSPASRFGIRCKYNVPDEAFMAKELVSAAMAGIKGVVNYHPIFDEYV